MVKATQYPAIKKLLENDELESMAELTVYVPKSVLYNHLEIAYKAFQRKIENPYTFTAIELAQLGEFFDVEKEIMFRLALKGTKYSTQRRKK